MQVVDYTGNAFDLTVRIHEALALGNYAASTG